MTESFMENARDIALYCRVSTDEQAREGVSLDEQQERLKAYCRAMGWGDVPLIFVDDGYSAKNLDRPQLNKLLDLVSKGKISRILVTKLDRLSRRLLDLLKLIDDFQQQQVSFISISESFDTNTPSGRLTLQVLGAVAEFERERIRERVFDNMLHAANQGKWLSQSPYGYDLKDKELVINEDESKIVKLIYENYLQKGMGYYSIAKELNEKGVPSKQKKEWSIRSVKILLTNPVYKGTLVWNRTDRSKKKQTEKNDDEWVVVDHTHPAIIDAETWESVQKRINKKNIHPRSKTSPHLLGGILKCGNCGAAMSISWHGPKTNRRRVYRCSANKNKGTCTSKSFDATDVESWFKEGLFNLSKELDQKYVFMLVSQVQEDEQKEVQQQTHSAKNRYKRKVEAYTAGLIELEDLQAEKGRLEKIMTNAENQKSTTTVNTTALEELLNNKIITIIEAIDNLPVVEAKSLIQTLVEKVILYGEKDIEISLLTP
ncbi:recombinase family protein [Litchfieldia alkalitelluris]|uniref:recombinase family protein n=1 Tax=Litchfieldia alkalitelluris TaxID=304268 RepID=UPI0009981B8C|nr:recombinase family protein [Litchfieldia alkalitelluris]